MWFKNLSIYRLPRPWPLSAEDLSADLAKLPLTLPGAIDAQSTGWVSPRGNDQFVHVVNQQVLLAFGAHQKLLPNEVINQFAADKIKETEENEGRRVGRKETREIRESVTIELLPRFTRRRTTFGWIDPVNGWLIIDSATSSKADEFLGLLRATNNIPLKLLRANRSPAAAMTGWVAAGEAPKGFTIDQDLSLESAEHAKVRYVKHSLEGEGVRQMIAEGKVATQLAMTWNDRISFVLTDDLRIKRLAFLDILKEQSDGQAENEEERFDLDFALMTGEVARLLDDLVEALGGEVVPEPDLVSQAMSDQSEVNAAADRLSSLCNEDGVTATISGHNGEVLATFGHHDHLYDEAKAIVITHQRASISLVQRHMEIGYNRAARLIEAMETKGVVSVPDKAGNRTVLVPA